MRSILCQAAIILIAAWPSCAKAQPPEEVQLSGSSFTVEKGIAKTSRRYLLVANAGKAKEKQIHVVSECEKPFPSESAYGKCKHSILIMPGAKTLTLTSGESVILAEGFHKSEGLNQLLATIKYSCCAGLSIVDYYDWDGEFLGSIETHAGMGGASLEQGFRFGNKSYNKDAILMKKGRSGPGIADTGEYGIFSIEPSGRLKSENAKIIIKDPGKYCSWDIKKFEMYNEREKQDIFDLEFESHYCDKKIIQGKCTKILGKWVCKL